MNWKTIEQEEPPIDFPVLVWINKRAENWGPAGAGEFPEIAKWDGLDWSGHDDLGWCGPLKSVEFWAYPDDVVIPPKYRRTRIPQVGF